MLPFGRAVRNDRKPRAGIAKQVHRAEFLRLGCRALLGRLVVGPVRGEVQADNLRVRLHEGDYEHAGDDEHGQEEPRQAKRVHPGMAGDRFSDKHERWAEEQSAERAERDIAERLAAHRRGKHVGRSHAHLLRAVHAHPEGQKADDKHRDALDHHRAAKREGADERKA